MGKKTGIGFPCAKRGENRNVLSAGSATFVGEGLGGAQSLPLLFGGLARYLGGLPRLSIQVNFSSGQPTLDARVCSRHACSMR